MFRSTSIKSKFSDDFREWVSSNRFTITSFILIVGLISFEMFNYSTTDFALRDLLGDLRFLGIPWATILAIAFCGIDFAGIARLFMPDEDSVQHQELWFLFAAWFLAATMNAILTWWGVSMSLVNHTIQSSVIVETETILQIVPVFVAIMVWLTRILLIGSFSFSNKEVFVTKRKPTNTETRTNNQPTFQTNSRRPTTQASMAPMQTKPSASMSSPRPNARVVNRPEPEYVSEFGQQSQPSYFGNTNQNNSKKF